MVHKGANPLVTPVVVVPSGDLSFTLACTFSYIVTTHTRAMYVCTMYVYVRLRAYTRRRKNSISPSKECVLKKSALNAFYASQSRRIDSLLPRFIEELLIGKSVPRASFATSVQLELPVQP